MAFLEKFSPQERDTLVSLPYRAGLWVSVSDNAGGSLANVKEREALEKIIMDKAKGMFQSAFVHEIMAEAVIHKAKWPEWEKNLERVAIECRDAASAVDARLNAHDADAYREAVMTIGVAVAKTFREYDAHQGILRQFTEDCRLWFKALGARLSGKDARIGDMANVSFAEDKALSSLAAALGLPATGSSTAKNQA